MQSISEANQTAALPDSETTNSRDQENLSNTCDGNLAPEQVKKREAKAMEKN